jgi:transcriptional regulator with XRE-family HTH domain
MDRKEFGSLVASLRQDMDWTQFQLAEYGGLNLAVISQIERGVKKHLEPELLVRFANAFQLTTLERKEFLFAATGVDSPHMVRQPTAAIATDSQDAERSLETMMDLVGRLRVPAFLLDVYSDVLAANYIAFTFFQVPLEVVQNAALVAGGYNALRLVFGKDLVERTHFLTNWDDYATNTMRFFREASLRYRARPYFRYPIEAFRNPIEYPLFDRYWKIVSSVEKDRAANFDLFVYDHDIFGHLEYATATTICMTAHGELLLNQYMPADDRTKEVFDQMIAQAGAGVIRYAPWPEKPMP